MARASACHGAASSPVVLRLGGSYQPGGTGWHGLIRGWVYFDRVLSSNEIAGVNALVPRTGMVAEGDSKTAYVDWLSPFLETAATWGEVSVITNSAVSGSSVWFGANNMTSRWAADAVFKTNAQYPTIIYSLRGGQNDGSLKASRPRCKISAIFGTQARTNNWKVMAWTLDRTSGWTSNPAFYTTMNDGIRAAVTQYDYLVDAETFYTNLYGAEPFTNALIYADGVHETYFGACLEATNCAAPAITFDTIPGNGVTVITKYNGFDGEVAVPNTINGLPVTGIANAAFQFCPSLTNVIIAGSVTNIGSGAFGDCPRMAGVYFQGNVPGADPTGFTNDAATIYYLPGTAGWGSSFCGIPAVPWNPQPQTGGASFGVRTNRFGFNVTGSSNLVVVLVAATNLTNPVWLPVAINTLTNGACYFSDPQWTNYPGRFYGLRPP